uniref:Uncharacterized protein n=1 Tax=Panagrolaimus sp. JU765 TaxID=591449 RepID=A0AC34REF6_9BILA
MSKFLTLFLIFFEIGVVFCAIDQVYDNGLAKICKPIDKPLDVLFIIDGSGSVEGPTFEMQLELLNRVIDTVNVGENETQIGVLQYASYTFSEFNFKTYRTKEGLRSGVKKIRHKSGTTKAGKALDKAYHLFNDLNSGSRKTNPNVGQVAIIVSDGHSHDDPYSKAEKLRDAGVKIIGLGIGPHINMNELVQITDDPNLAFADLTSAASLLKFTNTFKKLAIGEECKFARGEDGAKITCSSDSIKVEVSTTAPFAGHLYIDGQFYDPKCKVESNTTEIVLNVGLTDCGIQRQFSINPRGFLFETKVKLQFHPFYVTPLDKTFNVRCFYQDKLQEEETAEIDWELLKEHAQLSNQEKKMPCSYKVQALNANNNCGTKDKMSIGEKIVHKWECNSRNFDTYQSMLVHSCFLIDVKNDVEKIIIDENGCSLDENIIKTPEYLSPLMVTSKGIVVSHPDSPLVRIHCSLRFCDRLMGECDEILPPKCNKTEIQKRQSGFPVSIKALGETQPQLVTFDHSKINKTSFDAVRRRLNLDQRVSYSVGTKTQVQPRVPFARHADIKLNTQPVRIVENSTNSVKTDKITDKPNIASSKVLTSTTPSPVEFEEYSVEVDDIEVKKTNDLFKGADDPFQEPKKLSKDEQTALERELLNISPQLDENLFSTMSTSEILLESPTISIFTRSTDSCLQEN